MRVAGLGARADATATAKPGDPQPLAERKDHAGFFSLQREAPFEAPAIGVDAMVEEGAVVTITWRVADGSPTTTEIRIDHRRAPDIAWPT